MTNSTRNDVPAALDEAVRLAFARFPVAGISSGQAPIK
jgi:hypothetical protein